MFRMHEHVRAGDPGHPSMAWRADVAWPRGEVGRQRSASTRRRDVASDPFFGRGGKLLAVSQRDQRSSSRSSCRSPARSSRPRSSRSTITRITSEHVFGINDRRRGGGAHRVRRLRPRADRAGALSPARLRLAPRGRRRSARRWACEASHLADLDPAALRASSAAHAATAAWPETNCYVDLWIELLHALASSRWRRCRSRSPSTRRRPVDVLQVPPRRPRRALRRRRHELNVWRSLHRSRCRAAGPGAPVDRRSRRVLSARHGGHVLSHASTSRRRSRSRRSIVEERRLGYFHNAGYYELDGDDFAGVFRLEGHRTDPESPAAVRRSRQVRHQPRRTRSGAGRRLARAAPRAPRATARDEPVPPLRRAILRRSGVARWRAARVLSPLRLRDAAAVRRGVRARRRLPPLARSAW